MPRRRQGARPPARLDPDEGSSVDELARCVGKLRADRAAVQAGLTLRWSNGQTEAQVMQRKLLKRQEYGRAKFAVLCQWVL